MSNEKNLLPYQAMRKLRVEANISQRAFAKQMGVSQAFLCDLENGRRRLTYDQIAKLPAGPIREGVIAAEIERLKALV